jgi:hypothetical protein
LAQQNKRKSQHLRALCECETQAQRILDAAATLILQDGYDKTTIEDIAHERALLPFINFLRFSRETLVDG